MQAVTICVLSKGVWRLVRPARDGSPHGAAMPWKEEKRKMKRRPQPHEDVLPKDLLFFLNDLAAELRRPVTLREVAMIVEERLGPVEDAKLLLRALDRSPSFARARRNLYVTREGLLQGARLRIMPTAREVSTGILVPGHRFLPLWWGSDGEAIHARNRDGVEIPFVDLELSFSDAFPYHYLLGYNWIPSFVRGKGARDLTEQCLFHVFDMRTFYDANGFHPGDFILAEVTDAWEKTVTFHVESREDAIANVASMRRQDVALEKAFLSILEQPYTLWSIPEQLFQALAAAPASLREVPGSTFERFLARTPSIVLQEVGLELAAFPRGTSPFQLAVRRTLKENVEPDCFADPLDQLLTRLGVNLRSASVRGLLRLAACEGRSFGTAAERIVPANRLERGSRQDVQEFKACLKEMWQDAVRAEKRQPLSEAMIVLYQRAASLKDRVLHILRQLDVLGLKADELPSRPLLRMVEIDELAECILQLDAGSDASLGKAGELGDLVADVEKHLGRLQEEILSEAFV
jgi:hypothetical protein